ncbi:MAG: prepilin-type N-terminal cleavage/methylation domain-containing protein [Elusimicrobiota bacterium]|jgi:prepilin-type N-terminal cleavage/methylation domain-containing protein|nr:prepilin-type N-terminal cleavage/methylation domain-containing protein [Elusimicrobiota bacterium]
MKKVLIRIKRKWKEGFTLSEMLVALIVIVILGMIAYPIYSKAVRNSRVSDALEVLSMASMKQEAYIVSNDRYASTFDELKAPIRGLRGNKESTESGVEVGNFKYTMRGGCLIAERAADKYSIYRNYETNKEICVGEGCEAVGKRIPTGEARDINCKAVGGSVNGGGDGGGEEGGLAGDFCDKNPSLCCPSGTSWNGNGCTSCVSGGSSSCTGLTSDSTCTNGSTSCTDCSGTTLYTCNEAPQVCTPGDTSTKECSKCAKKTCNDEGTGWSDCTGEGICEYGYDPNCSSTCECESGYTFSDGGNMCIPKKECDDSKKPELTRDCGNKCGKESGTVECDSATGQWKEVVWSGECEDEGYCKPGEKYYYNEHGYYICSDQCEAGGLLQCDDGYYKKGMQCLEACTASVPQPVADSSMQDTCPNKNKEREFDYKGYSSSCTDIYFSPYHDGKPKYKVVTTTTSENKDCSTENTSKYPPSCSSDSDVGKSVTNYTRDSVTVSGSSQITPSITFAKYSIAGQSIPRAICIASASGVTPNFSIKFNNKTYSDVVAVDGYNDTGYGVNFPNCSNVGEFNTLSYRTKAICESTKKNYCVATSYFAAHTETGCSGGVKVVKCDLRCKYNIHTSTCQKNTGNYMYRNIKCTNPQ